LPHIKHLQLYLLRGHGVYTGPVRSLLSATLDAIYAWPLVWTDIGRFKTLKTRRLGPDETLREIQCRVAAIFFCMYIAATGVLPVNLSPGFLHAALQGSQALDSTEAAEEWIGIWAPHVKTVLDAWPRDPDALVPTDNDSIRTILAENLDVAVCSIFELCYA